LTVAVYLDHAAGSPLRRAAAEAYLEAVGQAGNPSSVHGHGQAARRVLEEARERLAAVLDCDPPEVVLTSGGTESVNLAIVGAYRAAGPDRRVLLVAEGEHAATVETVDALVATEGAEAVPLPVDGTARLEPAVLAERVAAAGDRAALVSFLWANNEVGTVNPVAELTAAAGAVPVHVDAVAAFGGVPVGFRSSGAALLSVSAHKVGGPPGIGALVVGRRTRLEPLLHGGGQQRGLRSGTEPAAAALAFAVAAEEAVGDLDAEGLRLAALRDRALAGLLAVLPGARLRGADPAAPGARLPGNLHLTVPGADGEELLLRLDAEGVSVSTGSACQAGVTAISSVLLAMGVPVAEARGALRISLGHTTMDADIDALLAAAPALVPLTTP
jgi:cysteine desulfurase